MTVRSIGRWCVVALAATLLPSLMLPAAFAQSGTPASFAAVVDALNDQPSQRVTEVKRSWRAVFDAYLDMTAPPFKIGAPPVGGSPVQHFEIDTVHPKMKEWAKISEWAKANGAIGVMLDKVRDSVGFAMPYGKANVDAKYQAKGLFVDVGVDGNLRRIEYPYMAAIDTIATYSIVEMYRRLEAGEPKEAFKVAIDGARLLRHLCDRVMLVEKSHFFELLSDSLAAQRDAMWVYRDRIPNDVLRDIAIKEYPFLAPGRSRLEMPEGERIVAEALLREVFDSRGQAEPDSFGLVFGELQAKDKPLTQFGAAKRWSRIAAVHGSLDASLQRLVNIYDDWWRRWRMRAYDPMFDLPTELSRTNPIRYGAVIYSIADIQTLFDSRKRLVAEVGGVAMAAGMCGYRNDFKSDPDDREKTYATYVRKSSDFDPWDKGYGRLLYRFLGTQRKAVDTPAGRVWVEGGVLYARGKDHEDGDFGDHTADGSFGDMILWPPMRALEREQGLRE